MGLYRDHIPLFSYLEPVSTPRPEQVDEILGKGFQDWSLGFGIEGLQDWGGGELKGSKYGVPNMGP